MAKERGAVMPVLRNLLKALMPRKRAIKFIGEDYNGTKYYEDPERPRQRGRSFEPVDPENFQQEIPAEWEAWLRYRRNDPPTPEEVNANAKLILTKQNNAAELEAKYTENKGTSVEIVRPAPQLSFPTYDDYKDFGRLYKPKIK